MSPAELPQLSALQFLALGVLVGGEQSGRTLREQVAQFGVHHSHAAFYQFMARLERDGYVKGWYEQVSAGDQTVRQRCYRITRNGERAFKAVRAFNEAVERMAEGGLADA